METKYKIVLVRHGESVYNAKNLFCGWHDADLSEAGVEEAKKAGQMLKDKGFEFDIAFTSVLRRAIRTLWFTQEALDCYWLPVEKTWRLNERHYGALQGLNKSETAEKYGEDQVKEEQLMDEEMSKRSNDAVERFNVKRKRERIWRRSYDIPPPHLEPTDERWSGKEKQYKQFDQGIVPACECLKDCVERTLPYWHDRIVPAIRAGKRVIISAHGNSLRGLVKYLDNIPDDEIAPLNIPTGIPLVYELDENLRPVKHYYLASAEDVAAATAKVVAQGQVNK